MQNQLAIFACSHLLPELTHVMKKAGYHDVILFGYPAHCKGNAAESDYLINAVDKKKKAFAKIVVISSSCLNLKLLQDDPEEKTEIIHLEQCQEILLNRDTLHHFIQQGCYIITNGWLKAYKKHIHDWGFDKDMARSFFHESMKKILLLDTGIPGNYRNNLISLSDYIDLPYEVLPIGLSVCEKYLSAIVSEFRADQAHKTISDKIAEMARERADYLVIVNQLGLLVDLKQEVQIVREVFSLLNILFAPESICYRQYRKDIENQRFYFNDRVFDAEKDESRSFSLEIFYQGELTGIFELAGVKFPEYIESYKRLGRIISQICSLAIANARKYEIMEEQKEQLALSNRSKDKFFSILAHDLRSPFNALLGLTEILSENLESYTTEELQIFIKSLNKSTINLNRLLENLLEWSKINRGIMEFHQEKLPLKTIIHHAISLYREVAIKKSINLRYNIPENINVFVDQKMVDSVIRNLVSNAIKFTSRKGTISLSATKKNNKELLVTISDTGIGMNKELLDNLFKIDAKVNRPGTEDEPSTGLGLLLCKEFVEMHGKKIWVKSKENQGSTFYFTLPLA
ncbi:MAG: DUF1638 domain-containing protein [Bacteroidales bacterium]|nr:DUF1638 domain-containing protein [Bacteroidales bacterium]